MKNILIDKVVFTYDETKEYVKNGHVYCKKCNKRVDSKVFNIANKKRIYRLKCNCIDDFDIYVENQEKEKIEIITINKLKKNCFKNVCYQEANIETYNKESIAYLTCINYVKNYNKYKKENSGLYIYGSVGSGKTYLSCAIANELIKEYKEIISIINFSDLLYAYTNFNDDTLKKNYIKDINTSSLLIIDDFSLARVNTNFMYDLVYNIINNRYNRKLPIIFTSNIDINFLKKDKDVDKYKIYSRILELARPIKLDEKDIRIKNSERLNKELLADIVTL